MTTQLKATEQYFPVMLMLTLYKVVLTLECVDEILQCEHSYKRHRTVLSYCEVYHAVVLTCESVD